MYASFPNFLEPEAIFKGAGGGGEGNNQKVVLTHKVLKFITLRESRLNVKVLPKKKNIGKFANVSSIKRN